MEKNKKLTVEEVPGSGWLVVCGELFSSNLCRDEALGVVAAMLYGNGFLPYLRTYAGNMAWRQTVEPIAFLPATVEPMPTSDFIIYRRELIADAKGI